MDDMEFVLYYITDVAVYSEVVDEGLVIDLDDATQDAVNSNNIEENFSQAELQADVNHENTSTHLHAQLKSGTPVVKFNIKSDDDDIDTRIKDLVGEELDIKEEIDETESEIGQSFQVEQLDSAIYSTAYPIEENSKSKTCSKIDTRKRPFQCNICGHRSSRKIHMHEHLITHKSEKPFKCDICDYTSLEKSDLQQHMNVHNDGKRFQCGICDYRGLWKTDILRHLKTHTGEKPFKCNVCKYRSSRKADLQKHMKTHTGEKAFKCNVCKYRSSRKADLQKHMKTHTGEKAFKCNVCKYRSSRKADLQKHMKTHTGEKAFKCNVCKYRSSRKADLQKHMKTHTV